MKKKDQKIIPCLWFNKEAEEAVKFYTSLFRDSVIYSRSTYTEAGRENHRQEPGTAMSVNFSLAGNLFTALNGAGDLGFNPAVSLFVVSNSEKEIADLWKALLKGGESMMPLQAYDWSPKYGWLRDRYGLSWQLMLEDHATPEIRIAPLIFFTGDNHGKAAEAIRFYTSIFRKAEIENILKYGKENTYAENGVKHARFRLEDQIFMAMDSGVENDFPFNETVSFMVMCRDQQEIDYYWKALSKDADLRHQQCGWLKDKFGISWQVLPRELEEFLVSADKERSDRVMNALLEMKKIELEPLQKAFRGEEVS